MNARSPRPCSNAITTWSAPGRSSSAIRASPDATSRPFCNDLRDHLIRPDRKDEPRPVRQARPDRQWIEAIIDTLKGQLTLEDHGGRTLAGAYARVAARLLALAAAIWHNWQTAAPVKRSLIAYDH